MCWLGLVAGLSRKIRKLEMCVCDCVSVCVYSLVSVCVNVTDGLCC